MGKVRKVVMGDVEQEKKQRKKADVRREAKKLKKVEGVGLHGGERTAVVEGTELKAEVREILEEVESGSSKTKAEKKKSKKRVGPKPRSKKYQEAAKLVDKTKTYPLPEAIGLVKKTSYTKFDGTVELHLNLNPNILGEKKEKNPPAGGFRGSVSLPHGTGKQVRVVVADDAILKDIEAGKINFDILVSHPSMMPKLAKVARILGPKGLMPNPKTGTVTEDVEKRVKELSHGQVNFKTEPENPIIHLMVGKVSFDDKKLTENTNAILDAVGRNKIAKATMTTTMGPGVRIALS